MSGVPIKRSKWSKVMMKSREKVIVVDALQSTPPSSECLSSDQLKSDASLESSLSNVVFGEPSDRPKSPLASLSSSQIKVEEPEIKTDVDENLPMKEEEQENLEFDVTVSKDECEAPVEDDTTPIDAGSFTETLESKDDFTNEKADSVPVNELEISKDDDNIENTKNDGNVSTSSVEAVKIWLTEVINETMYPEELTIANPTPEPIICEDVEEQAKPEEGLMNGTDGDTLVTHSDDRIPSMFLHSFNQQEEEKKIPDLAEVDLELLNMSPDPSSSPNMESEDCKIEGEEKVTTELESGSGSSPELDLTFDKFVLEMSVQEQQSDVSSDLSLKLEEFKENFSELTSSPTSGLNNLTLAEEAGEDVAQKVFSCETNKNLSEIYEAENDKSVIADNDMQLDFECTPKIPTDQSILSAVDATNKEMKQLLALTDFQLLESFEIIAYDTPKLRSALKVLKETQEEAEKFVTDYSVNKYIDKNLNLLQILQLIPEEVHFIYEKLKEACKNLSQILFAHSMQHRLKEADNPNVDLGSAWCHDVDFKIHKYVDALISYRHPGNNVFSTCKTCQDFVANKEIETKNIAATETADKYIQATNNDFVMISKSELQSIKDDLNTLNKLHYDINKKFKDLAPFLYGKFEKQSGKKNVSREDLLGMRYLPESLEIPPMYVVPEIMKNVAEGKKKEEGNSTNVPMPAYRTNKCSYVIPLCKKFEYVSPFH